jgi:sugar/nucleoside kinase (ribokinase family)
MSCWGYLGEVSDLMDDRIEALVFGSVVLDVICYPVDEVPRHECIGFEQAYVGPGGVASNVAVGLAALGIKTALAARLGTDDSAGLMERYWERAGVDTSFIQRQPGASTGLSIGLVDRRGQPRFIHTPGSSGSLSADDLDLEGAARRGSRSLTVAGFFILPGLQDGGLPGVLQRARQLGMITSLDVVNSPGMDDAGPLWPCLPHLDYFLCNAKEAARLTGLDDPPAAAAYLKRRGAGVALVKMGDRGVWAEGEDFSGLVPAPAARVVDTTGAGDAFAAGLVAALLRGAGLEEACRQANAAGARMVAALGATAAWNIPPAPET